jgi:tetratricopeptide (TPR) repeat protein
MAAAPRSRRHVRERQPERSRTEDAPAWWWLLPGLVVAFAAVLSFNQIRSLDIWFHLATGQWIWQGHGIPHADPFSHSAAGRPWIAHEWLFGLLSFAAYRLAGVSAITVVKVLLIAGLFALAAAIARVRGAPAAHSALVLAAVYPICRFRFTERPDLLSTALALVFLLAAQLGRSRRAALAVLPFVELVWVNVHGGTALLGWVLAFAVFADAARDRMREGVPWRRLASDPGTRFHAVAALSVGAASLLNPFGLRALTYGLLRAQSPLENREFQSFWQLVRQGADASTILFAVFAAAALALLAWRRRKAAPSDWLLLVFLGALSLVFFRFRLYFCFLTAPAVAVGLGGLRLPRRASWLPAAAALALAAWSARLERATPFYRFGAGIHRGVLPVQASAFLKEARLPPNMFNTYGIGGYLLWSLGPDQKVFIDGREDLYLAAGVLDEYMRCFTSRERWRALAERHGIRFAVVQYPDNPPARADQSLEVLAFPRPEWALVYFDDVAAVYTRRDACDPALLARWEIRMVQPLQRSTYLDTIARDPELTRLFLWEMQQHARTHPDSFRDEFLLGLFAVKRGSDFVADAVGHFERAVARNPDFAPGWANLGSIYLSLGRRSDARSAFEQALAIEDTPFVREQLTRLQ